MGLLDLDLKEGFDNLQEKLRSVVKKPISPGDMRSALARNDFAQGMEILEFQNNKPRNKERILLVGDMMPHQPFEYGGRQKIIKDYYPGNTEPSVQVLGPREKNVKIRGRLKAKRFQNKQLQEGVFGPPLPDLRGFAQEMQELMDAMRLRGNVVRITMGEWQRFGFLEETNFMMRTVADIDYELTFSIVGFNPPRDCKVLQATKTKPVFINKLIINTVIGLQQDKFDENGNLKVPDGFNRSFGDQIKDSINNVAEVINTMTDFVDVVLDQVDDVKSALARAQGLSKHARNTLQAQSARIGGLASLNGFPSSAGIPPGQGLKSSYQAASFMQGVLSSFVGLTALIATLQTQLEGLRETEPLARHRVVSGDTLQRIANKFYNDSEQWSEIYDHNKLTSTELEVGAVLEIPRVDATEG